MDRRNFLALLSAPALVAVLQALQACGSDDSSSGSSSPDTTVGNSGEARWLGDLDLRPRPSRAGLLGGAAGQRRAGRPRARRRLPLR